MSIQYLFRDRLLTVVTLVNAFSIVCLVVYVTTIYLPASNMERRSNIQLLDAKSRLRQLQSISEYESFIDEHKESYIFLYEKYHHRYSANEFSSLLNDIAVELDILITNESFRKTPDGHDLIQLKASGKYTSFRKFLTQIYQSKNLVSMDRLSIKRISADAVDISFSIRLLHEGQANEQ